MKLTQIIYQYFFSLPFVEDWVGRNLVNLKKTLFVSLFFVVQSSNAQNLFQGWDTTNSNTNCYECFAIEEFTEDAIATLGCGRIQSTAEVSMSFECKTLGVRAAGIKLTDGLRARAGCEVAFCALPLPPGPPGGTAVTPILIEETKPINKFDNITLTPDEIYNQNAIYKWYDEDNNLVYAGKDYEIANATAQKYKLEVLTPTNEIISLKEVELKYKPNYLETLYPNPANTGNLSITYKINEASSAYIMIYSYYMSGGISNNYIVDINVNEKNIDISSLPLGLYKVALITDGQIVDVKILSKL